MSRSVTCPTCRNAFPVGRGAISVCPRCGERVLIPSLGGKEEAPLPASDMASVSVECQLCGSRYYAKEDQLGQSLPCPDCHTPNVVAEAPPKTAKPHKKPLVELSDDDDFKLSEPVETPQYQALTRDALQFERALRSSQGLETKPLDVPAAPVKHEPAVSAKSQATGEDELVELEPIPDGPNAVEPMVDLPPSLPQDEVELELEPQAPPLVQPPKEEPREPAGPDDIDLFPEDRAPAVSSPRKPVAATAKTPAAEVHHEDLDDENLNDEDHGGEVTLQAAAQRVEHKPVVQLPKADPPEDKDDGSEVDFAKIKRSLGSFMPQDEAELPPELARRKPFALQALLSFMQPGIIGRVVVLALLVMAEFYALSQVMAFFADGGIGAIVTGFLLYLMAFLPGVLCFVLIAMFCFAIVQDTANGQDKIESWPELSLFAWFESALFFGAAIFLSGMPGALVAGGLMCLGAPPWVSLLLPMSLLFLFPPVLISMLEAGSVMEPLSASLTRSFIPLRKYWLQFYAWSLGIGILGLMVLSFSFSFGVITMLPGAATVTMLPLIYFRLLGRMAMMYRDYVAATSPDEEESTGPTVRHVVQ